MVSTFLYDLSLTAVLLLLLLLLSDPELVPSHRGVPQLH
jgi:hypothetical protein